MIELDEGELEPLIIELLGLPGGLLSALLFNAISRTAGSSSQTSTRSILVTSASQPASASVAIRTG